MAEELADLFAAARSATVSWGGAPVHAMWEITPLPEQLVVEFQHGAISPVQGVALKLEGGMLRVGDIEAKHITLWRDTAPKEICVVVVAKKNARLRVWNIWRDAINGQDVTQAWLRNSGMRIEPSGRPSETVLRCSDGVGPVDFDDLVVGLKAFPAL